MKRKHTERKEELKNVKEILSMLAISDAHEYMTDLSMSCILHLNAEVVYRTFSMDFK